jgi:outer membrane protein insertion porin family
MTFPACSDRPRSPRRTIDMHVLPTLRRRAVPALFAALCASRGGRPGRSIRSPCATSASRRAAHGAGTIFSYLPIKVGERVDDEKVAQAVKALYATGFFRDVRIEAQGRHPRRHGAGAPDHQLAHVRRQQGVRHRDDQEGAAGDRHRRGAHLRPLRLDRAEQELKRQYITRGKYAGERAGHGDAAGAQRVALNFTIVEGETASIARINIVGNKAFTERQLRREMQLSTPNWLSWYTKDDQYSKQKLSADLETLRSFYQNRGYLEFNIDSTQVSISPDKEEVYVTVNITEGEPYTVSAISIAGDLAVAEPELRQLIQVRPGETFSRSQMQASVKAISERMGADGYAFANVNAVPDIDKTKNAVAFTFFVDSGRRVYVRKINISGNPKTRDEVIRARCASSRAPWYDGTRIERSKVRVRASATSRRAASTSRRRRARHQRPGRHRAVGEREEHRQPAGGRRLLELGRCGVQRVGVAAEHLRLGQRARAALNTSKINRTISLTYTEPYWTVDGGRARSRSTTRTSIRPACRCRSTPRRRSAARSASACRSRNRHINFGFRVEHTNLSLFANSPPVYYQFVQDFGYSTNSYILSAGWSRDTRNDILYPTFGRLQSALVEVGLAVRRSFLLQALVHQPGLLARLRRLRAHAARRHRLRGRVRRQAAAVLQGVLRRRRGLGARLRVGIAGTARHLRQLAGRQAQDRRQCRALLPDPQGRQVGAHVGVRDAGQIYVNGFQPEFENFRYSAGLGLAWNSPIGPLKFSYAIPINTIPADKIQRFQFPGRHVF